MHPDPHPSFQQPVGLFPLPNVVLFPGATLPLQIFEPRYRTLVKDALQSTQLIAMALLRPGFEGYYYTNLAEIAPVVCVGRIREHVQVPDGRYFINLQGVCRARVRDEDRDGEYRRARLDAISEKHNPLAQGLESEIRRTLAQLLASPIISRLGGSDQCLSLLHGAAPLEQLVDYVAAALVPGDDIEVRQRLLEEIDVVQRTAILLGELQRVEQVLSRQQRSADGWPRFGSMN